VGRIVLAIQFGLSRVKLSNRDVYHEMLVLGVRDCAPMTCARYELLNLRVGLGSRRCVSTIKGTLRQLCALTPNETVQKHGHDEDTVDSAQPPHLARSGARGSASVRWTGGPSTRPRRSMHVQCMCNACGMHVQCMFNACSMHVHVQCMFNACAMHVECTCNTYTMRVQSMCSPCVMHV
jgi:hypothetical protein